MKQLNKLLIMASLLLLLSSCQLGRQYTRPKLDIPATFQDSTEDSLSISTTPWENIYTDTILQGLIYRTLEYNKDMRIAAAKIKELAAMKRIDLAHLFPSIGVKAYGEKEGEEPYGAPYKNGNEFGLKAYASWELDLWGNLRWAKDKSMAEFMSSIENQRAVKMSLIAQVAQNYFELVALDNELHIVKQTVEARRESLHLARIRYEGGLTSKTAFRQAQVELARTATLVPDLERKIAVKENELAFLTGEYPHTIERGTLNEKGAENMVLALGLPSTLLERRPDVRMAEQALIAANAQVGMAFTNLFPRISLTATAGAESKELADLLKSPYHLFGGNLLQPLFAMGKNRALLKAKKAACEQAAYAYEKTVLSAFKDAYNAIAEYNKIQEIYNTRNHLEKASKSALELAKLQYINEAIGYMDLLDAQRGYLDAQISLSKAIRDKQLTMVNLYKALGGGW